MSEPTRPVPGQGPLAASVRTAVERYFRDLHGHPPTALYDAVIAEVEAPLLETVMRHADNNQCIAAKILGINRNTLRKKLQAYGLIDHLSVPRSHKGKKTP